MNTSNPPTAYEAIALLSQMQDLAATSVTLTAMTLAPDGTFQGHTLELTNESTPRLAAIGEETRTKLQDSTLVAYAPARLLQPQHWMHVPVAEAALLADAQTNARAHDNPAFLPGGHKPGDVKLLATRFLDDAANEVIFYRIQETLTQLKRGRALGLLLTAGAWKPVAPEELILFRPIFEVAVINGHAFFTSKTSFERAFGFMDQLIKESAATFASVTSHLRIHGESEFKNACTSQPQMMAKMSSIRRSMNEDAAYAAAMTTDNLVDYIETHSHVDIDIVEVDGLKQLVFDPSPRRRFQIAKLLDDDFLRSTLTSRDYESSSKTRTT